MQARDCGRLPRAEGSGRIEMPTTRALYPRSAAPGPSSRMLPDLVRPGVQIVVQRNCSVLGQCCRAVMLNIQLIPNWSTSEPASSPHTCASRGSVTVPPTESFSK